MPRGGATRSSGPTRRSRTGPARDPRPGGGRGPRRRRRPRSGRRGGPTAIWSTTRSAAAPARRSSSISSASLTIRSSRQDRRRRAPRRRPAARPGAGAGGTPISRSETAIRSGAGRRQPLAADEPGDEAVRIVGLHPGRDLDGRPEAGPGGRLLEPRDDQRRGVGRRRPRASSAARGASPGSRSGSRGRARRRSAAASKPVVGRARRSASQTRRVAFGGDRRAAGRRGHRAAPPGSGATSHPATSRACLSPLSASSVMRGSTRHRPDNRSDSRGPARPRSGRLPDRGPRPARRNGAGASA